MGNPRCRFRAWLANPSYFHHWNKQIEHDVRSPELITAVYHVYHLTFGLVLSVCCLLHEASHPYLVVCTSDWELGTYACLIPQNTASSWISAWECRYASAEKHSHGYIKKYSSSISKFFSFISSHLTTPYIFPQSTALLHISIEQSSQNGQAWQR